MNSDDKSYLRYRQAEAKLSQTLEEKRGAAEEASRAGEPSTEAA